MLRSAARTFYSTVAGAALALSLPLAVEAQATSSANAFIEGIRANWRSQASMVTRSGEMMPDSAFSYRPVATVRTFGEVIAHVAGSQYMICAAALGEPARAEDAIEKIAKRKEEVMDAMKKSTAYCERAYAQNPTLLAQSTKLFGDTMTKFAALSLNAVHNGEHYGNLVTYLRMKGMVPPSSQPSR
jgi:uncharacterized damage-inducible protein DinB